MPIEKKEPKRPHFKNKAARSRHEQETQQIRILRVSGFVVLGVIALTLIFGLLYNGVIRPNKVLAQVNDEKITVSDFEKSVRYQRQNLIANYEYMQQLYQSFGMQLDENQRTQYEMQLAPEYAPIIGAEVFTSLIDRLVLDYAAKEEGFSVSDEEVTNRLQELFGYFPNGTPTPEPTALPILDTPTPSEDQIALLNYTATPEPTEIAPENDLEGLGDEGPNAEDLTLEIAATAVVDDGTISEEAEAEGAEIVLEATVEGVENETDSGKEDEIVVTAVVIEEDAAMENPAAAEATEEVMEKAAADVDGSGSAEIEPEENGEENDAEAESEPLPTETPYTEEMFNQNSENYFASNEYTDLEFERKQIYYELLRNKVRAALEAEIPREEDMVWARHILVATEEEANAVIERLNAGEEWNEIAAEVSTDASNAQNGGDLGWFGRGRMVPPFEEAAYAQEVGTYSAEPVASDFGFHIIQIVAHDSHPLTASDLANRLETTYTKWIDDHKASFNVKSSDDWTKFVPTEPALLYNTVQF